MQRWAGALLRRQHTLISGGATAQRRMCKFSFTKTVQRRAAQVGITFGAGARGASTKIQQRAHAPFKMSTIMYVKMK